MDHKIICLTESTPAIFSQIKQQISRLAEMLDVKPDSLAILDWADWPANYMTTIWRDKLIRAEGLIEGIPHFQDVRLQNASSVGNGCYVYESRLSPTLKYMLYSYPTNYGSTTYLIVPKKDIFKLRRNAIRLNKEACKVTNAPVLCAGVLEEVVQNTVGFLMKAKEIERYGVKIKRGIILDGPPGNGKTMLCRYIQKLCTQNNIEWGVITSSDIDSAYEDKALSELFTQYTVTFFDDIDVAYMDRSKGNSKMACSMLTAMDGMSDKGHLVRIFTTNEEVADLDPAFTRPGRIDKSITLPKPTLELRRRLVLEYWPKEIQDNINIDILLNKTRDFSFAELEAIRTFLVTNRILGDKTWDLDRAFKEYYNHRVEKENRPAVGFGQISN